MKQRDLTNALDMPSINHVGTSPPVQTKAAHKVLFSLTSPNLLPLLIVPQKSMDLKEGENSSINWGNSRENSCRKPQCYFCSQFSWLMLHFHGLTLLSVSLVSEFQNLFSPASQLVI